MMKRRHVLAAGVAAAAALSAPAGPMLAASADEIDQDACTALRRLVGSEPAAADLAEKATAVLVFPRILKAGVVVRGAYGEDVLLQGEATQGWRRSVAASCGLQFGAQTFGYALFFMNEAALDCLDKSEGWEIGSGPSAVLVDEGFAKRISSTTVSQDVCAVVFNQSGMMAGLGIEGSKITRFDP